MRSDPSQFAVIFGAFSPLYPIAYGHMNHLCARSAIFPPVRGKGDVQNYVEWEGLPHWKKRQRIPSKKNLNLSNAARNLSIKRLSFRFFEYKNFA